MHLDLEEQEQVETLKAWWSTIGKWIALGLVLVFVAYIAYKGYGKYQDKVSSEAAAVYETAVLAGMNKDLPQVLKTTEQLQQQYASTAYASMSGLLAANLSNSVGDNAGALKQLAWVEEKSAYDDLKNLARLRMVSILLDVGDQAALAQADTLLKKSPADGFQGVQLERRGDWYFVQDKKAEALTSYRDAWDILSKEAAKAQGQKELDPMVRELEKRNPDEARRLLKVKIDSLGGF